MRADRSSRAADADRKPVRRGNLGLADVVMALFGWADAPRAQVNAQSQAPAQARKPNILFIMGDDIGWMQAASIIVVMVGETPNIDRLANEGALFTDYYAMQSCTSGRNVFLTGMYPLRTGMIPRSFPAARLICCPALLRWRCSCTIWATTPVSLARTILVTTPMPCRPRMASRNTGDTFTTWTRWNR